MAAHKKKHDHRKKTAPARHSAPQAADAQEDEAPQDSVPQAENTPKSAKTPGAREAETPPPVPGTVPARGRRAPAKRHDGLVRKSTLYLTAALCLLLGAYLGALLPTLRGVKNDDASFVQQDRQQTPSPAGQKAEDDGRLRELEEAARKNPQNPHVWIQLGNQHFDGNKPREAIRAYERALSIKGDNPDVLTDMGIMYRQLGEFERAAEIFTQASKINPLHEQSRFTLGVVLFFDLNRKEEARKAWRALVGINPGAKTPDGALLRTMLDELQ
jgi:cytochrome c-type biogenesis protein CcmH/NrfG